MAKGSDHNGRPGELLGYEPGGEVEIITTIPTRPPTPREDLVRWCLQHRLPVPEAQCRSAAR